jgi:hypothetical protein
MLCNTQGHPQEDRARHHYVIVELKTCQDTRPDRPADGGATGHGKRSAWCSGYQRDKIKIYPILLVSGTIYAAHTIDTL